MEPSILLFAIPPLLIIIDFLSYLTLSKRSFKPWLRRILEVIQVLVYPTLFLGIFDYDQLNDCCSDSAVFSPEHRLSIYILIAICTSIYFYSSYRKSLAPPFIELIVNVVLLLGIVLNIFIAIQVLSPVLYLIGNIPIILLFIIALAENQKKLIALYVPIMSEEPGDLVEALAWQIFLIQPLFRYSIIFVLCLPFLTIITGVLLLFGQQVNSMILAFTQTYKHGFSQLDHLCVNVHCGGHFLCSVAAKGHKSLVKPQRLGVRAGQLIICNRQLLIANAFEELIEDHFPKVHKIIRSNYNKVGRKIHRHYTLFEIKWIADAIYILMKPLEWFFLLCLYTFDRQPENRIAQQYLPWKDRKRLKNIE